MKMLGKMTETFNSRPIFLLERSPDVMPALRDFSSQDGEPLPHTHQLQLSARDHKFFFHVRHDLAQNFPPKAHAFHMGSELGHCGGAVCHQRPEYFSRKRG